ncbi:MAG: 50S ribosomal protein L29 [Geobacter sp.]|nr:50S ribosomal protein L29 [Geobacter sp.]
MKANELRNMSGTELSAKGAELEKELFNLKFQLHTGRLENSARISGIRKDIARVKTIISEKRG